MSFRRNPQGLVSGAKRAHEEWRKANADLIEQTGLPPYCFAFENWDELLEHGSLVLESIDVGDLTLRQKAALLRLFLQRPHAMASYAAKRLIGDLIEAVERTYP